MSPPTREDLVKYQSTQARLVIETPFWAHPVEIQVGSVLNDGEIFAAIGCTLPGRTWMKTCDVSVLSIIPPPPAPYFPNEPVRRRTRKKVT